MLEVLEEIAEDSDNDTARINAADKLLSRAYGNPNQPVSGSDGGPVVVQIVFDAAPVPQESEHG